MRSALAARNARLGSLWGPAAGTTLARGVLTVRRKWRRWSGPRPNRHGGAPRARVPPALRTWGAEQGPPAAAGHKSARDAFVSCDARPTGAAAPGAVALRHPRSGGPSFKTGRDAREREMGVARWRIRNVRRYIYRRRRFAAVDIVKKDSGQPRRFHTKPSAARSGAPDVGRGVSTFTLPSAFAFWRTKPTTKAQDTSVQAALAKRTGRANGGW